MTIPGKTTFSIAAMMIAGSLLNLPTSLSAQATTTTTTTPQSTTKTLTIDSAQVVYVSGDDVALKTPDGSLRLLELNPGTHLAVDGKPASASDLKPGMTLSHVQLHSRTQAEVTAVTAFNGTVLRKSGRNLTLRLDDGTSKIFRVPMHATFQVNGQDTSYDNITRGMKISVTAVKTQGVTTANNSAIKLAQTPEQQGTLVVEE